MTAGERPIRSRASKPTLPGTSSTSNTRPVTRMMLASGRSRHHLLTSAGSPDASICQAAETGWAPGAGQPIRSQEQARPLPRGWPLATSAGTR